ncbi:MAG: hypothetical protein ACI8TP_001094 [Acidimicrobiales bacterium]|jgi:hypothetical protein
MARFLVTLSDDHIEEIPMADAYQQEGPLTTFFSLDSDRHVIDSWSTRLASFRTADITTVRRLDDEEAAAPMLRLA